MAEIWQRRGGSVLGDEDVSAAEVFPVFRQRGLDVFLAGKGHDGVPGVAAGPVLQKSHVLGLGINLLEKTMVENLRLPCQFFSIQDKKKWQ